jgi:hypothetical protein
MFDPNSPPEPMKEPLSELSDAERKVKQKEELLGCAKDYLTDSRSQAREWQTKAIRYWDMIHGRIDWSHKKPHESKVHVNRVGLAQEQIKAQIKQGLVSFADWINIEDNTGFESQLMSSHEAKRLVLLGIDNTDPRSKISDNIGIAAVENMLVTKLQPVFEEKKLPGGKTYKCFRIEHLPLNIFNFFPDPSDSDLYRIHEVEMHKFQVLDLSAETPSKTKPYLKSSVEKLGVGERMQKTEEIVNRGNDVLVSPGKRRHNIVIHEIWGTFLNNDGSIMKYLLEDGSELELKNVVVTMANECEIIAEPRPYGTWDGEDIFIVTQLLRTHINKYGRSLLAPGVDMNRAEDEIINAVIDAGLKEGYNIAIVKEHGLVDKSQISGGLKYGTTLRQNELLGPGEKLVETASTGQVPSGLLNVLQIVKSAGAENMRLNDISLSGSLPGKQVKATEIASSGQTIQGLFESIVSDLEDIYLEAYLTKSFLMMLQYANLLSDNDLLFVFYGMQDRADKFKAALKSPKKVYDELATAFRFKGKGIRSQAQSLQMSQALVNIFNMVVSNPAVAEMFQRRGLDMTRMFDDVLKGFKIDIEKYMDPNVANFATMRQLIQEHALAQSANEQAGGQAPQPTQGQPQLQPGQPGQPGLANAPQPGIMPGSGAGQ